MSDIDRNKESYLYHLLGNVAGAIGAGNLAGFIAGVGTGVITGDPKVGIEAALKTWAVVASGGFWIMESRGTINSAEGPERPLLHRLKAGLATVESALAIGTPAALISNSLDNPWVIFGGAFGALSGFLQFRGRFRKQPEIIFPEGTSVFCDTTFPDRTVDDLLPKVYRSDSIKDILEFRQVNQAQITRWAGILPSSSSDPAQISVEPSSPVNAIFITTARHFPAADPEIGTEMVLHDRLKVPNGESLTVGPLKHSESYWPYHPTIFENGPAPLFNPRKWDGFKDSSWEREVVILAQYQEKNALGNPFSSKPEEIVDKFWLIDMNGNSLTVRIRERVSNEIPRLVLKPSHI